MQSTANLQLPLYELDDPANLADGYNAAMRKLDEAYQEQNQKIDDILPVNTSGIENGAVTTNKLATAAVTDDKIANGTITLVKFDPDALAQIVPGEDSITTEMLKNGAVTRPKIADSAFDSEPTENSQNLLTSGAIYEALGGVELETDDAPTKNSTNLVTSGGVYAADQKLAQDISDNSQFGEYAFQTLQITPGTHPTVHRADMGLGISPNNQFFTFYGKIEYQGAKTAEAIPGTDYYGFDTGFDLPVTTQRIFSSSGINWIEGSGSAAQGIYGFYAASFIVLETGRVYVITGSTSTIGSANRATEFMFLQNTYTLNTHGYVPIVDTPEDTTFNLVKKEPFWFVDFPEYEDLADLR